MRKGGSMETLRSKYSTDNFADGVFEFYLFINPISAHCLTCQKVLGTLLEQLPVDVSLRTIAYHNPQIVADFLKRIGFVHPSLELRNEYYDLMYQAILAYKAASMQGRKRGRQFLHLLQEHYLNSKTPIDEDLILKFAQRIHLDLEVFNEDRRASYVRQAYKDDQRIAADLKIRQTPSLVMYEHSNNRSGLLIEGPFNEKQILESTRILLPKIHSFPSEEFQQSFSSLRLIKKSQ